MCSVLYLFVLSWTLHLTLSPATLEQHGAGIFEELEMMSNSSSISVEAKYNVVNSQHAHLIHYLSTVLFK